MSNLHFFFFYETATVCAVNIIEHCEQDIVDKNVNPFWRQQKIPSSPISIFPKLDVKNGNIRV